MTDIESVPAHVLLPGLTFEPVARDGETVVAALVLVRTEDAAGEVWWSMRRSEEPGFDPSAFAWQLTTWLDSERLDEARSWQATKTSAD